METFIKGVEVFLAHIPFSTATWFVIFILLFFVWIFAKANKDPNNPVRWEHMLIDSTTNRTSPYKLGFLIGSIVGTWVVITLMDRGKLSIDIFGAYLAFLVGGAGFVEWIKHGKRSEHLSKEHFEDDSSWKHHTHEEINSDELEALPSEHNQTIKGKGKNKK